jgi:2-octaprenyl-6-methoxyphenol hydroxylase
MRRADVRSRTYAVDLLNRSLLTDFLPVQAARALGLGFAASVPAFRRLLMRQGLASRGAFS